MSLVSKAGSQYGGAFVIKAYMICEDLDMPIDWMLAAICMETTGFKAKGPPWPLNKTDGGGGLIGFTPLKNFPAAARMGPVAQLDEVANHYRLWMKKAGILKFSCPEDVYLVTRGPYAIGKSDRYDMGHGKTKGAVLRDYRAFLRREGVTT